MNGISHIFNKMKNKLKLTMLLRWLKKHQKATDIEGEEKKLSY